MQAGGNPTFGMSITMNDQHRRIEVTNVSPSTLPPHRIVPSPLLILSANLLFAMFCGAWCCSLLYVRAFLPSGGPASEARIPVGAHVIEIDGQAVHDSMEMLKQVLAGKTRATFVFEIDGMN